MDTKSLLKKVRKIEIKTRGLSNQIFSGEYHSAFKGRGMTFSEVREYMPGDEIRTIDWNVTARFNEPFVKVFEEERELTVMILVDVSSSDNFGTQEQIKKHLITELTAVLAFSASQNNDKIGVLFFSDKIEKFIPPKKGKSHILRIIRELIEFKPESKNTNIAEALTYFNKVMKKKCIAFIISDFIDDNFEKELRLTNRKHDLVALRVYDKHEMIMPNIGITKMKDAETGASVWVNTSSKKRRNLFEKSAKIKVMRLHDSFKKANIDFTEIATDQSYIKPLMNLFKRRG